MEVKCYAFYKLIQVILGDADSTGIIQIYQNQTLALEFKAHTDTINQLKILPSVSLLASASKDTTVKRLHRVKLKLLNN